MFKQPAESIKTDTIMPDKPTFVRLRRTGPLDRLFVREAAKALIPFRFRTGAGLRGGHRLSDHFVGLGLPVPQGAEELQAILHALDALQPGAVRIDLTQGQSATELRALLQALAERSCRVLLHLVQPYPQARQMPEPQEVDSWREFVTQALEAYGDYVEAVELGSVVNRVRWAGYSLEGFMAAWEAAHALVRQYGQILMVGPNVTDFEPQYNAGLLGIMRSKDCLPDVQSSNLFAERTIEPEALDHKIAGHWAKSLIGYDLIRKSRLLASIATSKGVRRSWSTCAFWTLPRIARILGDEEGKAADYLVRYFVLCAVAGRFERIYWGPLATRREGLLDGSAAESMPDWCKDVVAYYGAYPAQPETWRQRSAFLAFQTVASVLPGATYLGNHAHGKGLEIHVFGKKDQVTHVLWTRNGCLAALEDCYGGEALKNLHQVRDRSGNLLDTCPDCLGERPLFLTWKQPEAPAALSGASLLPGVRAAPEPAGRQYFLYRDPQWRGLVLAADREEAGQLIKVLHPDRLATPETTSVLRKARNLIWKVEDPRKGREAGQLVVKKPLRIAWHKRLLDLRKPSKAMRSWNGTSELMRRGIETPAVVAYFESTQKGRATENWFICEHLEAEHSVRSFFAAYAGGKAAVSGITFDGFIQKLVAFLRDMHGRGVYFRDLSGGNILVRVDAQSKEIHFSLIDTARARFQNYRFPLSCRVADLKRLAQKLKPEQEALFMEAYLAAEGRRYSRAQRLSVELYRLKAAVKRSKRKWRKKFLTSK